MVIGGCWVREEVGVRNDRWRAYGGSCVVGGCLAIDSLELDGMKCY